MRARVETVFVVLCLMTSSVASAAGEDINLDGYFMGRYSYQEIDGESALNADWARLDLSLAKEYSAVTTKLFLRCDGAGEMRMSEYFLQLGLIAAPNWTVQVGKLPSPGIRLTPNAEGLYTIFYPFVGDLQTLDQRGVKITGQLQDWTVRFAALDDDGIKTGQCLLTWDPGEWGSFEVLYSRSDGGPEQIGGDWGINFPAGITCQGAYLHSQDENLAQWAWYSLLGWRQGKVFWLAQYEQKGPVEETPSSERLTLGANYWIVEDILSVRLNGQMNPDDDKDWGAALGLSYRFQGLKL